MKTLIAGLAAGGLAYVGFAPSADPPTLPAPHQWKVEPVRQAPPPPVQPPKGGGPFDPNQMLRVFVPDGYNPIMPGDYILQPGGFPGWDISQVPKGGQPILVGNVAWQMGGRRNFFTLNAVQFNGRTTLVLISDFEGFRFEDARVIAADGTAWMGQLANGTTRFPNATSPWVVHQP